MFYSIIIKYNLICYILCNGCKNRITKALEPKHNIIIPRCKAVWHSLTLHIKRHVGWRLNNHFFHYRIIERDKTFIV